MAVFPLNKAELGSPAAVWLLSAQGEWAPPLPFQPLAPMGAGTRRCLRTTREQHEARRQLPRPPPPSGPLRRPVPPPRLACPSRPAPLPADGCSSREAALRRGASIATSPTTASTSRIAAENWEGERRRSLPSTALGSAPAPARCAGCGHGRERGGGSAPSGAQLPSRAQPGRGSGGGGWRALARRGSARRAAGKCQAGRGEGWSHRAWLRLIHAASFCSMLQIP